MADAGVFDYVRVNRALAGLLKEGDQVDVVAVDDATRHYWVLTSTELLVLDGETVTARTPLQNLQGESKATSSGFTLTVRAADGTVMVATFRRPTKVAARLEQLLSGD